MQRQRDFRAYRGSRGALREAARAPWSSRSATGAKARCTWSRFRPAPRSTTTSCRSGARARRPAPRANTSTPTASTGARGCRSRCRSPRWSRPASAPAQKKRGSFVIDFAGENLKAIAPAEIKATVSADKGKVRNVVSHTNPEIGGIARQLRACAWRREDQSSCARNCCAATSRSRKSGWTDGRREAGCGRRRAAARAVSARRGAARHAGAVAARRRRARRLLAFSIWRDRGAPCFSCSARRSR